MCIGIPWQINCVLQYSFELSAGFFFFVTMIILCWMLYYILSRFVLCAAVVLFSRRAIIVSRISMINAVYSFPALQYTQVVPQKYPVHIVCDKHIRIRKHWPVISIHVTTDNLCNNDREHDVYQYRIRYFPSVFVFHPLLLY